MSGLISDQVKLSGFLACVLRRFVEQEVERVKVLFDQKEARLRSERDAAQRQLHHLQAEQADIEAQVCGAGILDLRVANQCKCSAYLLVVLWPGVRGLDVCILAQPVMCITGTRYPSACTLRNQAVA